MALISLEQQQAIKPISDTWGRQAKITGGVTNFQRIAEEVEELDLRKYLGDAFLNDLQENPDTDVNALLLNGGAYINCDGRTVKFKGVRTILAYLIFRSYLPSSKIADTFTGAVMQRRPETDFVPSGDIKREQRRVMDIAEQQWELTRNFLNVNTDSFPLWECTEKPTVRLPKIYGVRKSYIGRSAVISTDRTTGEELDTQSFDASFNNDFN